MMFRAAVFVCMLGAVPYSAYADPATHTFAVTSAETLPGDCYRAGCISFCKWQAKVTNISSRSMPSATLSFEHPHPGLDAGMLAATVFDIPALSAGESQPLVKWVNGLKCADVRIRAVSAKCDDARCPYAAVRILPAKSPRLKALKVDIDR